MSGGNIVQRVKTWIIMATKTQAMGQVMSSQHLFVGGPWSPKRTTKCGSNVRHGLGWQRWEHDTSKPAVHVGSKLCVERRILQRLGLGLVWRGVALLDHSSLTPSSVWNRVL